MNLDRQETGDRQGEALFFKYVIQPQHWNQYAYTLNNPIRYTDPDGQQPQEGADIRQRQDIKDLMEHRITEKEYWNRQNARGVGAAAGAAIVAAAIWGPEIGATVLMWSAVNPDKVEMIAQVTQETLGGPPAMITGVTRMTEAELSMATYLAAEGQNVEKLAVSTVQGARTADFVVNGVTMELKTLGGAATANTLKNDIARAVGQGGGNVLIDARSAAQITAADAQRAAARVFGADSRLQVVRIVGQDFDVTITRQAQ